jgi:hypothetical protein
MTHAHVRRRLSAYLEGELDLREEASLESHLLECAPCAAELRALRRAIELLHSLPAPEPGRDLGAAVIARLRAGEGQPRRFALAWLPGAGAPSGWLAPLALAMGVGAVLWLGQPGGAPDPLGEHLLAIRTAPASPATREPRAVPGAPGGIGLGAPAGLLRQAGAPLPSIATCLGSAADERECAGWDHWWVELALADARRFAHELDGLPASVRDRQLRRLSAFAARSGSAVLVGDELRRSRDPGAIRYARRFERGAGAVPAGWSGR